MADNKYTDFRCDYSRGLRELLDASAMTMHNTAFEELKKGLGNYKLDDALLFLNFVLQASRDPELDAAKFEFAQRHPDAITHFKVEFLAKWLIIQGSNLSPYQLDWPNYLTLSQMYNRIEDPIVNAPPAGREILLICLCA